MSGSSGLSPPAEAGGPAEHRDGHGPGASTTARRDERIDLLVRRLVRRLKDGTDQPELRLVIADGDVDRFLNRPAGMGSAARAEVLELAREQEKRCLAWLEERRNTSVNRGMPLRLARLVEKFGLKRTEVDAILIAVAPELDPEYGRQYAYIHDDATRRQATTDLIARLLSFSLEEALEARSRLTRNSPIFRWRLVRIEEGTSQAQFSSDQPGVAESRVLSYLLGDDGIDGALDGFGGLVEPRMALEDLVLSNPLRAVLRATIGKIQEGRTRWLYGAPDSGRRTAAAAIAKRLGLKLLLAIRAGSRAHRCRIRNAHACALPGGRSGGGGGCVVRFR
jgi:hypothetical protein